jgi:hypothetical protein
VLRQSVSCDACALLRHDGAQLTPLALAASVPRLWGGAFGRTSIRFDLGCILPRNCCTSQKSRRPIWAGRRAKNFRIDIEMESSKKMEKHEMFFAHSTKKTDRSDWQPLSEHSHAVSALARAFASVFHAGGFAAAEGLLHDVGKYTEDFLSRLGGAALRVDHATRGAMLAVEKYGMAGYLIAYAIAGHHAGLANGLEGGNFRYIIQHFRLVQTRWAWGALSYSYASNSA